MPGPVPNPAELAALADQCVLCGLCLPHCPTYGLDRIEPEGPRGRIQMLKALAEGRLDPVAPGWIHLDHCLGCRNCEPVCPAGVRYGEILVRGRALLRQRRPVPARQRALEWLLARPRALAAGFSLLRRLRRILPPPWRRRLVPVPRPVAIGARARPDSRGRVSLFTGCVSRHYSSPALAAASRVLGQLGWEIVVPPAQTCCGALAAHAGDAAGAARLALRNRQAFAADAPVLLLDSGCQETLAGALGAERVFDLVAFVQADPAWQELSLRPADGPPLALHLPCTQRNVTGTVAAHRAALGRIPGLVTVEVGTRGCCGAAGSHAVLEPGRAQRLRDPLLQQITASGAVTLATANIGCRLHLQAGLPDGGPRLAHPIQILAEHLP
ncbi:MAG TPA: (Fe-S)-binding protein [Xanthomonadaceae bacterium]|nr:(Fe-S)-binding protein [Xanthomonadaceae bacterium]